VDPAFGAGGDHKPTSDFFGLVDPFDLEGLAECIASGPGAVAAAIISDRHNVLTRSKEALKVYFDKKPGKFTDVWLEGSAKIVYDGSLAVNL